MTGFTGTATDTASYTRTATGNCGVGVYSGPAHGVFLDPAAAPLLSPYSVEAGHSMFLHFRFGYSDGLNNYGPWNALTIYDNSGAPWMQLGLAGQFQVNAVTQEDLALEHWITAGPSNGGGTSEDFVYTGPSMTQAPATASNAVWTNFGASIGNLGNYIAGTGGGDSNPGAIDIKVDIASTGVHTITVFRDGDIVIGSSTFDQVLMTNLNSFTLQGNTLYNGGQTYSEVIATEDLVTIGGKVFTKRPAAAGPHQEWSGSVTDVNQVIPSDTTFNEATTSGLRQTYTLTSATLDEGAVVAGAFNQMRARSNGGAPANIQSMVTAGGTDYTTSNLNEVLLGFADLGARYDVNPHTGVAWAQSDLDALDAGFASET